MIQISNDEVTIFAKLRENQNCILLQFKASYSDQISEVFEKGFEGFRQRLNQEIFLPKNKTLFILTDQNGRMYNQSESVEESLQIENNQCLVYYSLKSEIGERDNIRLRINNIRQAIQGLEEQVQMIQFNPHTEKTFQVSIQEKKELGNVQFQFMCSGNEQTIQQLKQKALNLFSHNFPNIEIFVEYDYFTIKNDNREYGIEDNHQLVSHLFQMEQVIQLQLYLRGPIDANLSQTQFGNLFYKLVVMGQDIQYVFQQFYSFIEERGEEINEEQLLAIEDKILETSIEECQLLDLIKEQKCDYIRQYGRSAIKFAKQLSKSKMVINIVPHVGRGLRILTIFLSNLELNYAIASSISFSRIALSTTGFIVGGLAMAAEIGYLIYHRKKFTNKMFYLRIGAAVGKQVSAIVAYSGGMVAGVKLGTLAVGAGMPTLMPIILGLILGVSLAFITLLCLEKAINYFWGSDTQIAQDVNFLNDHDKNKCYFSSLQAIDCDETTPTSEIKKLRLKRLKELHPDKHNDQNKKDEFIKQYIAFEIVLSFRENQRID